MRLEFRAGDAFRTAIELLLLICLLAAAGQKCLGGSNYDQAWSIQQTADGGYVVAGYTYSNDSNLRGFSDHWTVKLNPSGNMEWQKRPGGTAHDEAYGARQTADGMYAVADRTNSSYGNVSGNHSPADPWIVKPGEINCTIAAPDMVCSGSIGNLASTAESGDTYAWSITNGAITSESNAESISFTAGGSGTTRLTLIVTKKGVWNKCHKDIAIKPLPDCSWSSNAPVCNGTAVQFSGPTGMDSYRWEFGDGQASSSQGATHLFRAPGTYAVTLRATNGSCRKDCTKDISITPGPDCSWTSNAPVCNGTAVLFSGPIGMDSYQWDFGDGFACVAKDPVYLYHAPGTYTVSLTATRGGCSKSCAGKVEVTALDCSWSSNSPVCNGTAVQFTGPSAMDSYRWDFGDGQVGSSQGANHLYSAPGTYAVNLTVTNGGCSKTCAGKVEVTALDCSWSSNSPVCNGTAVQFTGPSAMDSYQWDFGDGQISSSQGASHLYSAPGTYTVNLTAAKGGCSKECTKDISVLSGPDCSWSSNAPVCNGTPVQIIAPSAMDSYQWDFGDGQVSTSQGASHLYSAPGTYTVNLTAAKGGCSKECTKDISILPVPDCTITAPDSVCSGLKGNAASTATSGASYAWSITNGEITSASSAQSIAFTAGASGSTRLKVTVTAGGCSKECTRDISITPGPDCSWTSSAPVCNGTAAQFSGPAGMDAYRWEFGDGQISSSQGASHLFSGPGTYAVNLTVSKGGCTKERTRDISILPGPEFNITAPDAICSGLKDNAASTTTSGAAYAWSIANVEITSPSDRQSINFTVGASGTTRLKVTVTSAAGCTKEATKDITITPGPDCSWTSNAPVCNGTAVQFSGPAGMDAYLWDFGDGSGSQSEDPVHLYPGSGTYAVSLTVTKCGSLKSCRGTVEVTAIDCSWTSSAPVCNGTAVQFSGPAGMATYQWDFGDGQISSSQGASHLYRAPGTYAVNLTAAKGGCSKDCTKDIFILPGHDCTITATAAVCSGSKGNAASAAAGATYAWSISNGEITSASDAQSISFTAGTSGTIRLTVNVTKKGSWSECDKDIAIKPKPDSSLTSDLPVGDKPAQQPSERDSHQSNFGDGQISSPKRKVRIYPG
jgi:PKD repeat protein